MRASYPRSASAVGGAARGAGWRRWETAGAIGAGAGRHGPGGDLMQAGAAKTQRVQKAALVAV
jgi:hypothetical protein